jgi:YfiH family protein
LHPTNLVNQLNNRFAYNDFNLGHHVGDCADNVRKNRNYLAEILPTECKIQWLDQVHGNHVVIINEQVDFPIQADAMITQSPNIALAIMTADCLPILLSNHDGTEIAAIHGGWRCLANNILSNTLAKMRSHSNELYAWLGPCIGSERFEVGKEVQITFTEQSKLFSQAFTKPPKDETSQQFSSNKKYLANLQLIAKIQLEQLGITNIKYLPECTYTQKNKYYSFRREQVTGRMATIICRI